MGRTKVAKTANAFSTATDILTSGSRPAVEKKKVWEKSIGTMSSGKGLGSLIKKKPPAAVVATPTTAAVAAIPTTAAAAASTAVPAATPAAAECNDKGGTGALGLLGAYSGSDSQSE